MKKTMKRNGTIEKKKKLYVKKKRVKKNKTLREKKKINSTFPENRYEDPDGDHLLEEIEYNQQNKFVYGGRK